MKSKAAVIFVQHFMPFMSLYIIIFFKEIGRQSTSFLGSLHLLGNLSSLQGEIADGLADLKETGDYMGFVRHVRGGLAESYYKVRQLISQGTLLMNPWGGMV